ncbi:BolA/IbaG family iron-sulfur metabolism protein [Waterburya agarophytonicola K14]|uniref:BolA/IbaG family iron-sulfur metabolism protein n=1 Tax=Waterburya agarophytonicola KI4 TaxID=2874699 RepID=A0A964FIM2_9CYAN|nr:BolA/IbaG family iron-sulfur metabolism protein [Waterburya agarophytonicola KI4]
MISPEQVQTIIQERLANAEVKVVGDGQHFEAIIVSPDFAGKNKVKQHQMVYGVLQDELASETIHALSLKTFTPEAWQATGQTA